MAKQGQHNNDDRDPDQSPGPNKHRESTIIVTGTYKKKETYRKQAALHQDTAKRAQFAKPKWDPDGRHNLTVKANSAVRAQRGPKRSGSDSNADKATRGY